MASVRGEELAATTKTISGTALRALLGLTARGTL